MEHSSMTSLISAYARACHTEWNPETAVFHDAVAAQLLTSEERLSIGLHLQQGITFFEPGYEGSPENALRRVVDKHLSANQLGRSAYAEAMLQNAVHLGTRQYLILAAGLDTFAWRQPTWAKSIRIIELDHPLTAADKTERLVRSHLGQASNVWRVPANFRDSEWSAALKACPGYDFQANSFCSLLGLSYYLEKPAFAAMLRELATLLPIGSSLVFDYPSTPVKSSVSDRSRPALMQEYQPDRRQANQAAMAKAAGEPMVAEYGYLELESLLASCGFLIYEQLDAPEINERYFKHYNDANPNHQIEPFGQVSFCLAVRHDG